ncbi:hypothetical protein Tco_0516887 [Tanacetum coccineum]
MNEYMASYTKRVERFEKAIFKQREEINNRLLEMFRLIKELASSKTLEKVLVREEVRNPVTKNVNAISLVRTKKDKDDDEVVDKNVIGINELSEIELGEVANRKNEVKSKTNNEITKSLKEDELVEMPMSQPISYYLKHEINKEIIEGLVKNQRFNDSLLAMKLSKMECEACHSLLVEPMRKAILKRMVTKKEDIGGNFVIPCIVGGLKYVDALVDQGSDVNAIPLSTYNRLTNERLVETDIRLSLANFVILDIKEDKRKPFILGTPFLTTAKSEIRFDKGTITLKSDKSITSLGKTLEFLCKFEERENDEINPQTAISLISERIMEWEERIKFHYEKELEFNQQRSKMFGDKSSISKNKGCSLNKGGVT